MEEIKQYNKQKVEIESRFLGLPHCSSSLAKSLITRADPETGIVRDISYQELAKLLTINPAPGRKNSGTPTKQTVRNYIKSIERECGEYFKVISEGQNLLFLFPELPKIFSKIFEDREVNTVVNSRSTLENTGVNDVLEDEANTELNTEANTPNDAVKKFIYINKTKQTKQNNSNTAVIFSAKKSIADDFYPDAETIEIALSKGYSNVIEPEEIKAFIKHNITHQTQWANFNPVFLCWLERNAEYQAQQKQKSQGTANHMECIDEPSDSDIFFGIHEPVMAPREASVTNINNNKQKQSISDDFTPNAETIARARALGQHSVTEPSEIQSFIDFNKASGSQWADYNLIYLLWLSKSQAHQQQKQAFSGRMNHASIKSSKAHQTNARARVEQAYASQFVLCEQTRRFKSRASHGREGCNFVVAAY